MTEGQSPLLVTLFVLFFKRLYSKVSLNVIYISSYGICKYLIHIKMIVSSFDVTI